MQAKIMEERCVRVRKEKTKEALDKANQDEGEIEIPRENSGLNSSVSSESNAGKPHGLVPPRCPNLKYKKINFQGNEGDDRNSVNTSEDGSFCNSATNLAKHMECQSTMEDDAINSSDEEKEDTSLEPAINVRR